MPTRRRIALLAGFAGVALAAPLLAAAPASASTSTGGHKSGGATPNCIISQYTNTCLRTVDGTPWSGNDNVRRTPSLSGQILTTLAFGHHTNVWCYKTGDSVSGNPYWDFSGPINGHMGFIADAVLNTGGTITSQVDRCLDSVTGS